MNTRPTTEHGLGMVLVGFTKESSAPLVPLVALPAPKVLKAPLDLKDPLALLGLKDLRVFKVKQAPQARTQQFLDLKEKKVTQETQDQWAPPDLKDLKDRREKLAYRALLAHRGLKDSPERTDKMALKDFRAFKVQLAILELQALLVQLVHKD
jgi:hypothetical protein